MDNLWIILLLFIQNQYRLSKYDVFSHRIDFTNYLYINTIQYRLYSKINAPIICTSICLGLSMNFSTNMDPLPKAARASDVALS